MHQDEKYKISILMWALLNNNVVTRPTYLFSLFVEVLINIFCLVLLYKKVHSVPYISNEIIESIKNLEPEIAAIGSIIMSSGLILSFCVTLAVLLKSYQD